MKWMFTFVLNILCHNFVGYESPRGLGVNWSKVGTKRLSLGTNRLDKKDPWVRNDWIPPNYTPIIKYRKFRFTNLEQKFTWLLIFQMWISHLDKFLCELCINCAADKQEWRTLRGSSLCSVSSKVPVGEVNKQEITISQLRAHSLVYHSDDSRSRLPCVTWYTNFCTETLNYKVKKSSLAWYSLLSFWN